MVAAENLVVDSGADEAVIHPLRGQEVIDAPACVLLSGTESVAPPAVGSFQVWMEMAERIRETARQELCHLFPLLVCEASIPAVALWVLQVDFLVRHIHVAADDDWFLLVEREKIGAEILFLLHPVVQPAQLFLAVGCVDVHQIEVRHFQRDHSALVVVFLDSYSVGDFQRSMPGEDSRSAVSLLFRIVPIRGVAWELDVQLPCLHLCLLQAEEIRIERSE